MVEKNYNSLPRPNSNQPNHQVDIKNYNTIGYSSSFKKMNQDNEAKKLHVIRRKNDVLRKRNDYRRNTIDVTGLDVKMAEETRMSPSRSTNHLNAITGNDFQKQIDQMSFNATSMPSMRIKNNFDLFCSVFEIFS